MEVNIQVDGRGRAKLETYDEEVKDRISPEVNTEDYGRNWSVIQGTAKSNKCLRHAHT